MSGRMKSYKEYLSSLEAMKEPIVPKAKLDMRGILKFAQDKGIPVSKLTQKEKEKFIEYI